MDEAPLHSRLRTGLRTSVVNNASAFAFSIMITGSFGMLSRKEGSPIVGEIYLYGMTAVLGFVVLETVASKFFRRRPETYPVEVTMLGTAFSFLSVAAGMGGALAGTALFDDTVAWAVGPALASLLFVGTEALEMALVQPFEERWVTENRDGDENP